MPKPRKAKRAPQRRLRLAASVRPAEDTTVRGYAPPSYSPVADTAQSPPATDTAVRPAPTTRIRSPPRDSVAAPRLPDTTSSADPARSVARDTSSPSPGPVAASTGRRARTLPIGTEIHAALDDSINSRTDSVGPRSHSRGHGERDRFGREDADPCRSPGPVHRHQAQCGQVQDRAGETRYFRWKASASVARSSG